MKFLYNRLFSVILSLLVLICFSSFGQDKSSDIIKKAMKDELFRNMNNLKLDKLKSPFFISYSLCDASTLYINSTLGSIVKENVKPFRKQDVRIIVGDHNRTNENFVDINSFWNDFNGSDNVCLDNDYNGIRRSFCIMTDTKYKKVAESYESKISAINQQNLASEELNLPDFSKADKIILDIPAPDFTIEKQKWENASRELSGIFSRFKNINSSNVQIFVFKSDVYFVNTEGTEVRYPVSVAAIRITCQTMADDGEKLFDFLNYYALDPKDLPSIETIKTDIEKMAGDLVKLKNAKVFDESYSGPVLIEGQALAEIIEQKFFSMNPSLIAGRKPILSDPQMASWGGNAVSENIMEGLIDKKIISRDLTIRSIPGLSIFENTKLIGGYQIDAEGVKPPPELVLVENGVLKSFISGRTPTLKSKLSNGHCRIALENGGVTSVIGPGVISVTSLNTISKEELRKKLISAAKEEDLEYAYIIRKLEDPNTRAEAGDQSMSFYGGGNDNKRSTTKLLYVYRVSVKDGSEELVRTVKIDGFSIKSFKRILGVANKQYVYNTMVKGNKSFYSSWSWQLNGILSSIIVPDGILFEELDLQKDKKPVLAKPPVVSNPVGVNK
jgi:hypothetical protein